MRAADGKMCYGCRIILYPHTLTSTLTTFAVDCQLVKGESEGVRVRKEKNIFCLGT